MSAKKKTSPSTSTPAPNPWGSSLVPFSAATRPAAAEALNCTNCKRWRQKLPDNKGTLAAQCPHYLAASVKPGAPDTSPLFSPYWGLRDGKPTCSKFLSRFGSSRPSRGPKVPDEQLGLGIEVDEA